MHVLVERANPQEFSTIGDLNVEAYREFASSMTPDGWAGMETNLRAVEARAKNARFFVVRNSGELAGSVGYCPPGKADPAIFPPEWAAILLLAVSPRHRGRGLAKTLVSACIDLARQDAAHTVGLFTSELMAAARHLYQAFGFRQDIELPRRHGLRYWRYRLSLDGGEEPT
jgi:ribosomal protein S18 acetylase RimI-like enzyme